MEEAIGKLKNLAVGPWRFFDGKDYLIVVDTTEWRIITHIWKKAVETVAVDELEGTDEHRITVKMKRAKWSTLSGPIDRQALLWLDASHVLEFVTSIEQENLFNFKCDGFIYGHVEEIAPRQYRTNPGEAVYPSLEEAGKAILNFFTRPKNLDA